MRRELGNRLLRERPALVIGVDAPDFNLDLEARMRRAGIRTLHYVSPSIWAWRGGRIKRIAQAVDHMLTLFPFEEDIYRKAGIPATFVGHPLADIIPEKDQTSLAREQLRIPVGRPIVALLPGSRQSELRYMANTFIKTARLMEKQQPGMRFLVPMINRETRNIFEAALYEEDAADLPLTLLFGHARDAIAASDAVLVASGTATLEVGLYRKPMVIAYRMSPTTWRIMSRMRYQPWVGLPNIILRRFLVPELLQDDATPENLAQALMNVMTDPVIRERLPRHLAALHESLKRGAGERAAEAALQCMS
jgi:lipid-A-disaccharide synthase